MDINRKKKENDLLHLRLYFAGMIIDKLSDLQKELNNKYILMKSYVVLSSSSGANNSATGALLTKSNNKCL